MKQERASELTAFIADDEPNAREKLRDLLSELPDVRCLGEAQDGHAAVTGIDSLRPDVAFLDIRMPGLSGLEVVARVTHRPAVVFTTAFDRYAVTAFELHAIDYLLKPFGTERLQGAIARAREALARRDVGARDRVDAAFAHARPLERIFARDRGRIVPIATRMIEHIEGCDDYVAIVAGGRRHLVNLRMNELESRLDPDRFVRVHRSHIVNLDYVAALVPYDGVRLAVEMRDGTRIRASRERSKALREMVR